MTAAKHTSPRDRSFRRSLLRNAAGGVGLVVLVAAIFGVLGMIGRDDPTLDIADGPEEPEEGVAAEEAPDEEPAEAPVEEPAEAPAEEPVDEGPAEPAEEGPAEPAEEEPEEPAEEEPAEEPSPPAIDPSEISVQVLDGYREDGGAAADAVYEQLESAGYRIIARNPAIAYEVTTVLWTAGYEEEGRQVAEEIGAPEAREQPGNLSTSVNVHVVVGADRG